ncbi:MAG: site-specific DNA-methyltransferase [Thermoguttaceae bacterium]
MGKKKSRNVATQPAAESYQHPQADVALRPDVGTQAQFRKKKLPATYRYDSSLSPSLEWDGENSARELGEWLLRQIEEAAALDPPHAFPARREFKGADGKVLTAVAGLADAVEQLKRLARPFLNWAGKAERAALDVPTLPLFVHERLSTKAIVETLTGHRKRKETQTTLFDLFGDPQHSITDQVLGAYEFRDGWTNRMILGDSLVVMNSLLHYENLGGQVQMIYMDPPYGVKFGSNFQPFVRRRDVKHNDDEDLTREPEMVQAYRDTWELGLHSYLTYMRERLLLARELLSPSGSIFVQISDENLHHVRELLDEVFGAENFFSVVTVRKTGGLGSEGLTTVADYVVWYAKEREKVKYRQLYTDKAVGGFSEQYRNVRLADGRFVAFRQGDEIPTGARVFQPTSLHTMYAGVESCLYEFELDGKKFKLPPNRQWSTTYPNMMRLAEERRVYTQGNTPRFIRYLDDFPVAEISNIWADVMGSDDKLYVVQTNPKVVTRCLLMTTDPGDLVLDPTCGSGTTAYVAEQWGRRWITADVSRVPMALARQRLLTATFDWYELKDDARGPAGGFVYKRKQNKKGEEVGGIVPHVTLKSIANNEPPAEEVLVDRPEVKRGITRVTGPFCVEATIPTPVDWEEDSVSGTVRVPHPADGTRGVPDTFTQRMLEILRKSPVLRLGKNKTVTLRNVRPPAKTLALSAEAAVDASATGKATLTDLVEETVEKNKNLLPLSQAAVALVFGPENGAVSQKLVFEAAKEAYAKSYAHLYVIGFAIQPTARELIEKSAEVVGVPATYVQATPDLLMGDLLKNMRSSQIFSVCGLPEIEVSRLPKGEYQVKLLGLDVFDPVTMDNDTRDGSDVPCWLLDTDYNDLCFHVSQAFFPRTGAWENLKRALRGEYDESVWAHLAGTTSAPFEPGENHKIAVKVIDDRGNELLVVKELK